MAEILNALIGKSFTTYRGVTIERKIDCGLEKFIVFKTYQFSKKVLAEEFIDNQIKNFNEKLNRDSATK